VIKIIIKLSIKLKAVDNFLNRLLFAYTQLKGQDQIAKEQIKKLAEKQAQQDLKRIVAYEKYGEASGFDKPIVARAGR
jgi:hypothetical protein